jgi:hypothetical protein
MEMADFKRTVVAIAITFDELVEYGKQNGGNIVNGMPWSFTYMGKPITHETDDCYLLPPGPDGASRRFKRGQMLVSEGGNLGALSMGLFEEMYTPIPRKVT